MKTMVVTLEFGVRHVEDSEESCRGQLVFVHCGPCEARDRCVAVEARGADEMCIDLVGSLSSDGVYALVVSGFVHNRSTRTRR